MLNIFWLIIGALICLNHNNALKENYFGNKNYDYLKVWVNNEPEKTNDILRFEAKVTHGYDKKQQINTIGNLLIALKVDSQNQIKLDYGDELLIAAKYLPVEPAYNPAEFNFKSWLAAKNIYHQTFINQNQIIKLNQIKGNPILKYAIEVRKKQIAIYRKLIINDEAFAVASTLVLGYRTDLNKDTLLAYSKTGTIHALSVSGMHVGIIYVLLNLALFFLDNKKLLRLVKLSLIFSLIWYYALLTGFSPSVLRAAIMLSIFIVAKFFNRSSNNYNILAFTAFCLLFYNPFLIWHVGFQLSFLAVFGLIYLLPKIYKWLYLKNRMLDKLWSTIALCLAAQIATFPLSIYYFHQFPLYFIFANIFILIPIIFLMYLGITILVFKVYFLAPIFEWIINFTNNGLKWIANLPFSGINAIYINQWQLILLSLTLILFINALVNYNKKLLITAILSIFVFQSYTTFHKYQILNQKKIIFFSLRKNYATAFIEAKKAIILTDLSPEDKNYQFFIKPALDQLQITDLKHIKWENDNAVGLFIKKENQILFHNFHVLLMDNQFNYKQIKGLPKFNAIWLHENAKQQISSLHTTIIFNSLIVDATNNDYNIEKFKQEADKFQIQHHILKKNNSYLIDLNEIK